MVLSGIGKKKKVFQVQQWPKIQYFEEQIALNVDFLEGENVWASAKLNNLLRLKKKVL